MRRLPRRSEGSFCFVLLVFLLLAVQAHALVRSPYFLLQLLINVINIIILYNYRDRAEGARRLRSSPLVFTQLLLLFFLLYYLFCFVEMICGINWDWVLGLIGVARGAVESFQFLFSVRVSFF